MVILIEKSKFCDHFDEKHWLAMSFGRLDHFHAGWEPSDCDDPNCKNCFYILCDILSIYHGKQIREDTGCYYCSQLLQADVQEELGGLVCIEIASHDADAEYLPNQQWVPNCTLPGCTMHVEVTLNT